MESKIERKMRFYFLLPYGYTSQQALILASKIPEVALCEYSPIIPMEERLNDFQKAHMTAMKQVVRMEKMGYIEQCFKKYGKPHWKKIRAERLTRAGFYLLTSTPDETVEQNRISWMNPATDRKKKEMTLRSDDTNSFRLRAMIYDATANMPPHSNLPSPLEELFLEAVSTGEMTVLAKDMALAEKVDMTPARINNMQIFRSWRTANINALFMVNGFLTYLDRRPMDTGWTINGIKDEKTYQHYIASGEMDMGTFIHRSLRDWYAKHPQSYSFFEPDLLLNDSTRTQWFNTPAFYTAAEINGFFSEQNEVDEIPITGAKNILRHTFSGVAIGPKTTYIVYHTRPENTPWSERIEMTTIEVVQRSLATAKLAPDYAPPMEINNAIMVCASVFQFASLFQKAKDYMPKKWRKTRRVGIPYDTVNIVPINGSGAMQLRCLMLQSPHIFEMQVINSLLTLNPKFQRMQDNVFQLTYEDVPVLVAHSMDFQRIFYALEEYYSGTKFYVSCYPGQVKFIRKIMPDVEFL